MREPANLPVRVELQGSLRDEVIRWIETEAGWQVVAADGPLAPAFTLCDAARPGARCVVVVPGVPSGDEVRQGLLGGAIDVLGWPGGRERLRTVPTRLADAPPTADPLRVRVAGTAGGVGTSTLALALGGLLAWSGRAVVVVGGADLLALCGCAPWAGPGATELAALGAAAAEEFPAVARPVAGVPGLRVLAGDGAALGPPGGWPVDVVVVDHRTALPAVGECGRFVVGTRPDGALLRALPLRDAASVLVMGNGPLDRASVRRLLGRSPEGWLPASARVARAGLAGRVPASLPGRWSAGLRAALARRPS